MRHLRLKQYFDHIGLLELLEDCRDEEEVINLLKRENLWGGVVDHPELEELKESYKNSEIEADGILSLNELDKVAGGMRLKSGQHEKMVRGLKKDQILSLWNQLNREGANQKDICLDVFKDSEGIKDIDDGDVEAFYEETKNRYKEEEGKTTSDESIFIAEVNEQQELEPAKEEAELEKPAELPMLPEKYAETHKNTLEIEKTEESHVDNQVEDEIAPNEGENVIVKEQAEQTPVDFEEPNTEEVKEEGEEKVSVELESYEEDTTDELVIEEIITDSDTEELELVIPEDDRETVENYEGLKIVYGPGIPCEFSHKIVTVFKNLSPDAKWMVESCLEGFNKIEFSANISEKFRFDEDKNKLIVLQNDAFSIFDFFEIINTVEHSMDVSDIYDLQRAIARTSIEERIGISATTNSNIDCISTAFLYIPREKFKSLLDSFNEYQVSFDNIANKPVVDEESKVIHLPGVFGILDIFNIFKEICPNIINDEEVRLMIRKSFIYILESKTEEPYIEDIKKIMIPIFNVLSVERRDKILRSLFAVNKILIKESACFKENCIFFKECMNPISALSFLNGVFDLEIKNTEDYDEFGCTILNILKNCTKDRLKVYSENFDSDKFASDLVYAACEALTGDTTLEYDKLNAIQSIVVSDRVEGEIIYVPETNCLFFPATYEDKTSMIKIFKAIENFKLHAKATPIGEYYCLRGDSLISYEGKDDDSLFVTIASKLVIPEKCYIDEQSLEIKKIGDEDTKSNLSNELVTTAILKNFDKVSESNQYAVKLVSTAWRKFLKNIILTAEGPSASKENQTMNISQICSLDIFHESGHILDFYHGIISDSTIKDLKSSAETDMELFKNKNYTISVLTEVCKKYNNDIATDLTDTLNALNSEFDGCFVRRGEIEGKIGKVHRSSYYHNTEGGLRYLGFREAFANVFYAYCAEPDLLSLMKNYIPKFTEKCINMIN